MNKNKIKLLLLPIFMIVALAGNAFAFNSVSKVSKKAFIVLRSTGALEIIHTQKTNIFLGNPFTIEGKLKIPNIDISIDKIYVQYKDDPSGIYNLEVSTNSFDPNTGEFTCLLENWDTTLDNSKLNFYYRIGVDYTLNSSTNTLYTNNYLVQNPTIDHRDIERISPYQRYILAFGKASHNCITGAVLEYYINGSSDTIIITESSLKDMNFQFKGIKLDENVTQFSYRIKMTCNNDSSQVKYYPYNSWIDVPVTDSVTKTVGTEGGEIILDNEDQRYGRSILSFPQDSLSAEQDITFTECDATKRFYPWTYSNSLIKLYQITPDEISLNQNAELTLYYGNSVLDKKYQVKQWDPYTSTWTDIKNLSYNAALKTITFPITELGYFGIFERFVGKDDDYRPLERVFMPGEKIVFRNLEPGDSVTIYNLKGKEIRTLRSTFEWDGRDSGGSLVESGSYIYQIKVNGKIISGSLALIR